jgi:hypothetical protein
MSSKKSSQNPVLIALSLCYSLSVREKVSKTLIITFSLKYLPVPLENQHTADIADAAATGAGLK